MPFEIASGSTYPGTCRSCGAAIVWAILRTGSKHPFNEQPTPLSSQAGLFGGSLHELVEATSHYSTCPDAEAWRK